MDGAGSGASGPAGRLDRKLLITCRHPFSLGENPPARLTFRRLGPLTLSGAAELTTSLPAIRLLGDAERDQVWRLTAGHPLAMEYLDLLLARGERYQDPASRIEAAITAGTAMPRTEPTELPDATAEQIASAAGDLMSGDLFGRLGTAARSLLIRASVFRLPVTAEALAARPGPIAECEGAGLLTIGPGHELGVHRWTVGALAPAALAAGQVDARLLITLAGLAANEPVRVDGFGGYGPGESPGLALRTAEIAAPAASARRVLAFVRAQRSRYLATRADLNPGTPGPDRYMLTIEFGAPAPLGMLR
ncbi:MAG: hypothetical protein ACRDOC_18420 [Streptosporangiaceae bacterium]